MAEGLLRYDDPRLGLGAEPLAPTDAGAKLIVAVLENLLRHRQFGVLAAPAAGFARRLLVIKSGNRTVPVFNPVLASAKDLVTKPDERDVLTGDLSRATCRAHTVTVTGIGSDGGTISVDAAGPIAHEAQQAFDLLAGRTPLQWLSPFQRAVVEAVPTPSHLNAAFAGLVRDINAEAAPSGVAFDWPMLTLSGGVAVDLRNPGMPADPALADLLALANFAQDPERILLRGEMLITLVPALATQWQVAPLHFESLGAEMLRFVDRVGDPRIAQVPSTNPPRYPLAIVDARDQRPDARALATSLALPEGLAIILVSDRTAELEQELKKAFIDVHMVQTPAAIFYVASRLELNLNKALTGLLRAGVDLARWRDGLVRLDKDGQERPVPF